MNSVVAIFFEMSIITENEKNTFYEKESSYLEMRKRVRDGGSLTYTK